MILNNVVCVLCKMASELQTVLQGQKPKWYLPTDNVAKSILNPAIAVSERFDCMSGYFNSGVLKELAHGMAQYLISTSAPMRLLVSSDISAEDQKAVANGENMSELAIAIVEEAFQDPQSLTNALIMHTKSCLSYLVRERRLQIKIVLMKEGIFHPKIWYFHAGGDVAVLSGSANATGAGLARNVEQLSLQRSWNSQDELEACQSDINFFGKYWKGDMDDSITLDLPHAIAENILGKYEFSTPPATSAYTRALQLEHNIYDDSPSNNELRIPPELVWEDGKFRHQGDAVKAWEKNDRQGILAMATGAGKTITSLIAATRLSENLVGLLVVIAVPTRLLLAQWAEDVRLFGLDPYVADSGTSSDHLKSIDEKLHALELGLASIDVVIITVNLLKDSRMTELFSKSGNRILLIADEMHNLGVERFTSNPPNVVYRLGLSATPERQYDPLGTSNLFDYFGKVVFEFSLEQAIGVCLVPYSYEPIQVTLNVVEQEKFTELTEKIKRSYARTSRTDEIGMNRIQRLLEQRRSVLESASGKIAALKSALLDIGPENIHHTLIYCTDKDPSQLQDVNNVLTEIGVRFHQITDVESSNRQLIASSLFQFRKGNLQVLTAKRILDEGFNIPEIQRAFILASTTVERQWTQRRGRILRLCPDIDKIEAEIVDFVTVPLVSLNPDDDMKKIVEMELQRVEEFTRLASNRASRNGPLEMIQELRTNFLIWNG